MVSFIVTGTLFVAAIELLVRSRELHPREKVASRTHSALGDLRRFGRAGPGAPRYSVQS